MKANVILILLFLVACKPEQKSVEYGKIVKPLAGPGMVITTNEDEPVTVSYNLRSEKNNKESVDLSLVMVGNPEFGKLSDCDQQKMSLSCTYTPNKDFNGKDSIVLKAKDGDFMSDNSTKIIIDVLPVSDSPTLNAKQTESLPENSQYSFILTEGKDIDSSELVYELSDLSALQGEIECDSETRECVYTPETDFIGLTSFTYKVKDEADLYAKDEGVVQLTVRDYPEVGADQVLRMDQNSLLNININLASDMDSDDLIYKLESETSNGKISNCFRMTQMGLMCEYRPNMDYLGVDSFTYSVSDDTGLKSLTNATVTINVERRNSIPLVGRDTMEETLEGEPVTFEVSQGSDPDYGTQTPILKYEIAAMPTKGKVSNCFETVGSRSCTYTPNAGVYDTTDMITYYVKDEAGAMSVKTAMVIIEIDKKNRIPEVGDDQEFDTLEEDPITFIVSAGKDEDQLDPNKDAELKYIVEVQPKNGKLTNCFNPDEDFKDLEGKESDRTCTYTPDVGFYDQDDFFTYSVMDKEAKSLSNAVVTIKVIKKNRIPKVGENQEFKVYAGEAVTFVASAGTDDDYDGDGVAELKYIIDDDYAETYGKLSNCFNATEDFTDGEGKESDRTCTFTANADTETKEEIITYHVMDKTDKSVKSATIKIKIENRKPMVGDNQTFEVLEGDPITFIASIGTDDDYDGDGVAELKYVVDPNYTETYGKLSNCFNAAEDFADGEGKESDRTCTFTANVGDYGKEEIIKYYVMDEFDQSEAMATITIKIKQKNQKPKVGDDQTIATYVDMPKDFEVLEGSDNETPKEDLIYTVETQPTYGQLSNCFTMASPNQRKCTYTPDGNYKGDDSFTYSVTDGNNQKSDNVATVTIKVMELQNQKPKVGANQMLEVYAGETLSFAVSAGTDAEYDGDGEPELQYILDPGFSAVYGEIKNCFKTVTFDKGFGEEANRKCEYTANADAYGMTETFNYYVRDMYDQSDAMATVTITIKKRNKIPEVGENQAFIAYKDKATAFEVNAGKDEETAEEDLIYNVERMPANGTLSPDCFQMAAPNHRKCVYTPNPGYLGDDYIEYSVIDEEDAKSNTFARVTFKQIENVVITCQNAEMEGKLKTMTKEVLFSEKKRPNGSSLGCEYEKNGNLNRVNGRVSAREEFSQAVEIPANAILCDADFVFFPDAQGNAGTVSTYRYDDELILTLNDYILMSTVDYSENSGYAQYRDYGLRVNEDGLVKYNWGWEADPNDPNGYGICPDNAYGICGLDYVTGGGSSPVKRNYCLGVPYDDENYAQNCKIPVTQQTGDISLNIPSSEIIKVGAITLNKQTDPNMPQVLDFGFIATGDNDTDCKFTDFRFNVNLKYINVEDLEQ